MVRGFPQGTAEFTWIPHLDMDVDVNEKNIDVTFHTNCNRKLNCKKSDQQFNIFSRLRISTNRYSGMVGS
jgi:hypothetical protein